MKTIVGVLENNFNISTECDLNVLWKISWDSLKVKFAQFLAGDPEQVDRVQHYNWGLKFSVNDTQSCGLYQIMEKKNI